MALDAAQAALVVRQAYQAVLGRAPDAFGDTVLVPLLLSGADPGTIPGVLAYGSSEAAGDVQAIFGAALGRAADPAGLAQFLNGLAHGLTLDDVRASVGTSPEAARALGMLYVQALGRAADAPGLAAFTGALAHGLPLSTIGPQLAASPEARAAVVRSFELNFGTAPAASTVTALQGELAAGRAFADVVQVTDRQTRTSGFFSNNDGYLIPPPYSGGSASQFISIADDSYRFYQGTVTTIAVPTTGTSGFGAGPDTIKLDLTSIGVAPVALLATLDGRPLGGGTIATTAQVAIQGSSTRDEISFTGDFGATFHDLRIAVTGDAAASGIGIVGGTFNGNAFILGGAQTDAAGILDVFPSPGPQPAIQVVSYFPFG